jgi:hypothetical protein
MVQGVSNYYHLPMMCNDHAPIPAVLNSTRPHTNKPFHFEKWWLMEQDFQDIAQQSWQLLVFLNLDAKL